VTNVAISTVNGAVNPEVEMSDRVASLLGTTLTEADVHRFLLDAADILGTESFAVYGPDLFFRWRLGERIVEIEPDYRPLRDEYELTVNSYNPTYPIDTDEYQSFKWGEAAWYPYLWSVELGRAPVSDWGPGEAYVVNWEMFEETTAKTLGGLPDNLALMPPQWRRPFTLRWDMGASDLGLVSFTGTAEGLTVTVESTGEQVLIPRNLLGSERSQISMRDVAAGLADVFLGLADGFLDLVTESHCILLMVVACIGPILRLQGNSRSPKISGHSPPRDVLLTITRTRHRDRLVPHLSHETSALRHPVGSPVAHRPAGPPGSGVHPP